MNIPQNLSHSVYRALLTTFVLLSIIGCGDKGSVPELPGITDTNATLIAFDPSGQMIDFVHIVPGSNIERVEFHAPENGEAIRVVGIGPSVHPDFPANRIVSSQKAEGYLGKVTAEIEDDVIQVLSGNGMSMGSPLTIEHLQTIKSQLEQGAQKYSELTKIIHTDPAILELKTDSQGNRFPDELSPSEQEFLETVIQAVKAKDLETLRKFTHRDADDTSSYDTVASYLETILEKDLHHYRFMRFTAEHPDNKAKLELHDGRPIRFSLEPKWLLTLFHTPEDAYMRYSADLIVGDDDGQLKFPASYADPAN
ncbi:MAG: hypothetical protein ACPGSB_06155 [Opitutales bacterium]